MYRGIYLWFFPHYCYYYWDRVPERVFVFIVNYYTFRVCRVCVYVVVCTVHLSHFAHFHCCDERDIQFVIPISIWLSWFMNCFRCCHCPNLLNSSTFNGASMANGVCRLFAFIDNHQARCHIRSFVYYYFYFAHSVPHPPHHAFNETKPRRRKIRKFVNFLWVAEIRISANDVRTRREREKRIKPFAQRICDTFYGSEKWECRTNAIHIISNSKYNGIRPPPQMEKSFFESLGKKCSELVDRLVVVVFVAARNKTTSRTQFPL